MQQQAGEVMAGRSESEELTVESMGDPREGVPVIRVRRGEGPGQVGGGIPLRTWMLSTTYSASS